MSEIKKVILHIGLPKTATTLLQQHVFTQLNKYIDYVGVKQPRLQNQEALFSDVWTLICAENSEYNQAVDVVKARIKNRLHSNNKTFVLSEECFCLDSSKTTWQEKLNRLANIFQDYDVQVLVTIRNPISAIFSYYVELYPSIKSEYPNLIDFASKSNLAKIYDYEYLDSVIFNAFDNSKITYLPFELLKNNRFLPDILNFLGVDGELELELPNTNSKQKSENVVKTHHRNLFSYVVLIMKVPLLSSIIKLPIIKLILKRPQKLLKKLKVPMSQVKIQKPTKKEIVKLNELYAESIYFINSKINLDYEKFKK